MMKFAAALLVLGATFAVSASAQNPPDIQHSSKADSKDQAAPAPVIAPLGIGTTFNATLGDTLDTRKTRAGDPVTAEIVEDVNYERCMIFPKGTRVSGHVVRVTSSGHGKAGSAIFMQFDKATMKDGQEVILNAGIQALAGGPAAADLAKSAAAAPHPLPMEEAQPVTPENSPVTVSTIYDSPRESLRPPMTPVPGAQGEFNSEGMFTPESRGAIGRPELKLYTPTSEGSKGTVVLSAHKNMRLDAGTRLLLVVQPPPTEEGESGNAVSPDLDPQ
jgi:hypothetical protein